MEEEQIPLLEHRHLLQNFDVCSVFARMVETLRLRCGKRIDIRLRDDDHLFAGIYFIQIFLRVFVFELRGLIVSEIAVSLFDGCGNFVVFILHGDERLIEQNISVIRQSQTECHESHDGEPDDDCQLFADRFDVFLVGHAEIRRKQKLAREVYLKARQESAETLQYF